MLIINYSGAAEYVFTLPSRTIRFYNKLWMRNPNFGVIHSWWVAEANLTANTNTKSDDHPLADTDDESQPTINLIYSILETLHTRLARLETAGVKT
jgi:hypothetical protein